MSSARDLPLGIQWHEGMLLSPQHFQQEAARRDAQIAFQSSLLSPNCHGVLHLEVDRNLLQKGTFSVRELEALMPDGLVVCHPPLKPGAELSLLIEGEADRLRSEPLTIYLVVPARRPGASPVKGDLARFDQIEGEQVADENTGEGEVRIPRLQPRPRLMAGEEPPAKFVSMPIAKVEMVNEVFTLAEYVPPVPRASGGRTPGAPLIAHCRQVTERLRKKAAYLCDQALSPSVATRAPQLQEQRSMIHSMVAALPPFEALVASGVAHPFQLYLALTAIVGQAAAVGRALVPPVLEPYDHNDPLRAFQIAADFIVQSLEEGVSEAYESYTFEKDEEAFRLTFDPDWNGRELLIGVRRRQGSAESRIVDWVESSMIGSQDHLDSLMGRRVPGVPRRKTEGEGDLLPSQGVTLFRLEDWEEYITLGERLEVRNLDRRPGIEEPVEIVLYVHHEGTERELALETVGGADAE